MKRHRAEPARGVKMHPNAEDRPSRNLWKNPKAGHDSLHRINIDRQRGQKSRNRGRGGTRGAAASSVGPTAGQRTGKRREMGRRQDRREIFFLKRSRANQTDHSAPASASGACSVEAARSRSCEKVSVGNILLGTVRAFSRWKIVPKVGKSHV